MCSSLASGSRQSSWPANTRSRAQAAASAQVRLLTRRLERLQQLYLDKYEVDLSTVAGAGAAGGLAGGLVAVGARLQSGFELLSERAGLDDLLDGIGPDIGKSRRAQWVVRVLFGLLGTGLAAAGDSPSAGGGR